jgi:uncharacterized protein (DUF1778 family)
MSESLKSRVISFRVSDDEYRLVADASKKHGFPSVSLFARSAALTENASDVVRDPIHVEFGMLWTRINQLTSALEQIASKICVTVDLPNLT